MSASYYYFFLSDLNIRISTLFSVTIVGYYGIVVVKTTVTHMYNIY